VRDDLVSPRAGPEPWCEDAAAVAERLGADMDRGVTDAEAAERLARVGPNQLEASTPAPAWRKLADQFRDPLVYLLLVAVAVSLVAWLIEGGEDVPFEVVVISLILVANAVLGYVQEARAEQAVAALQRMAAGTAGVVRGDAVQRVPTTQIVPGDVLVLAEGDAVAADARLVEAASLTVAEASLTGESEPVLKDTATLEGPVGLGDRVDMVFSGTAVARGASSCTWGWSASSTRPGPRPGWPSGPPVQFHCVIVDRGRPVTTVEGPLAAGSRRPHRRDDHDRAGGMLGQLLAHGSEQEAAKAADPATSDDDEHSVPGRAEERIGGPARHQHALDGHVLELGRGRIDHPVEQVTGGVLERREVTPGPPERHRERGVPRVHRGGDRTSDAGVVEGPAERPPRLLRTVDAGDDPPVDAHLRRGLLVPPDDRHRAGRTVEASLAHRAKHQVPQLTPPARTHHEQVGPAGRLEQRPGRQVADHDLSDRGRRSGAQRVGDRRAECGGRVRRPVVGIECSARIDVQLVEQAPGQERRQLVTVELGLLLGPADRAPAVLRAVDTHDNASHGNRMLVHSNDVKGSKSALGRVGAGRRRTVAGQPLTWSPSPSAAGQRGSAPRSRPDSSPCRR
jgi:E1-E2 ATPase/Cation transporter/ATPase, N-terminus